MEDEQEMEGAATCDDCVAADQDSFDDEHESADNRLATLAMAHLVAVVKLRQNIGKDAHSNGLTADNRRLSDREGMARRALLRWPSPTSDHAILKLQHLLAHVLVGRLSLNDSERDLITAETARLKRARRQ